MPRSILKLFARPSVIPVATVNGADEAVALAAALQQGGLNSIEITLRTPAALEAAVAVRAGVPGITLGIGTVTSLDQLQRAAEIGAEFAMSPGLDEGLARAALEFDLAYLPGICTPSELMRAIALGYDVVKVSPVAPLGGVGLINQLASVFPGIAFCATGGIREDTLASYLAAPGVFGVGGGWLAPRKLLDDRDWAAVESLARRAADICAGI